MTTKAYHVLLPVDLKATDDKDAREKMLSYLQVALSSELTRKELSEVLIPIDVKDNTCDCGRFWEQFDLDGGRCLGCETMICANTLSGDVDGG
jgi:hypothetical protein